MRDLPACPSDRRAATHQGDCLDYPTHEDSLGRQFIASGAYQTDARSQEVRALLVVRKQLLDKPF
jgi:hypothetical protein